MGILKSASLAPLNLNRVYFGSASRHVCWYCYGANIGGVSRLRPMAETQWAGTCVVAGEPHAVEVADQRREEEVPFIPERKPGRTGNIWLGKMQVQ